MLWLNSMTKVSFVLYVFLDCYFVMICVCNVNILQNGSQLYFQHNNKNIIAMNIPFKLKIHVCVFLKPTEVLKGREEICQYSPRPHRGRQF